MQNRDLKCPTIFLKQPFTDASILFSRIMTRRLVFDLLEILIPSHSSVFLGGRRRLIGSAGSGSTKPRGSYSYSCKGARIQYPWGAPVLGAPLCGCRWSPRTAIISLNDETSVLSFLRSQIIAPWFFPRIHGTTSAPSSSLRLRPLPPLPPFIPELCNFPLATVPPRRARNWCTAERFRGNIRRRLKKRGIGRDGDGGTSTARPQKGKKERRERKENWARTKTNEPKENDEN